MSKLLKVLGLVVVLLTGCGNKVSQQELDEVNSLATKFVNIVSQNCDSFNSYYELDEDNKMMIIYVDMPDVNTLAIGVKTGMLSEENYNDTIDSLVGVSRSAKEALSRNELDDWSVEVHFGSVEEEHYSIIAKDGLLTYDEADEELITY